MDNNNKPELGFPDFETKSLSAPESIASNYRSMIMESVKRISWNLWIREKNEIHY